MKSANGLIALTLLTSAAAIAPAFSSAAAQTSVARAVFGKDPDGKPVDVYTLKDKALTIKIITWGAHVIDIEAPDRNGKVGDIVLGYSSMDAPNASYLADHKTYMGSVVGRYGNRIAHGEFTLDGKSYHLSINDHGNTLHGGVTGFDWKNWSAAKIPGGVELTLVSPDGDMGFPGKLTAHVRYTLEGDKLKINYTATTDKPTVINLTNHSYFNLAGGGQILDHVAMIDADRYTPTDSLLIPTGELAPVEGTPFDFRKPTAIGARIHADNPQLKMAKGYDHNFVLNGPHDLAHAAVVVTDPKSGRTLTIYTTEPGVQFYTGNSLDGSFTGNLGKEEQYDGFCLETQHFPDSPNHPKFPTTTLNPGQTYRTTTIFQFTTK
jgi:aldose 1-epimerase